MKKAINECKGTIAYTLSRRMDEIDFSSLSAAKASLITILRSPEITKRADAEKFIRDLDNMRNINQLASTVGTYATGLKC